MIRLLKFDIIHPREWLREQKAQLPDLDGMSLTDYREWLISLASNYSDFYTHPLNQTGEWVAEEFFLQDNDYLRKTAAHLYGKLPARLLEVLIRGLGRITRRRSRWRQFVIDRYIRHFKPDVLFARSQPIPSAFWQRYRSSSLLVARLSARLPFSWHPNHFELLYTDQPDFQTFFRLHGVKTILNDQGFDARVAARLLPNRPSLGVVFVGGLGTKNFRERTLFFERIAQRAPFRWWGYWWNDPHGDRSFSDFPGLHAGFQGPTSGQAMFQIYHDADICLNDYVDTANGIGFNQRMFEVMGAGGFLLTRQAPNFAEHFGQGLFATYADEADCLRQIDYYLAHPEERAAIAARGQAFVLEKYSYERIALQFGADVKAALAEKRASR